MIATRQSIYVVDGPKAGSLVTVMFPPYCSEPLGVADARIAEVLGPEYSSRLLQASDGFLCIFAVTSACKATNHEMLTAYLKALGPPPTEAEVSNAATELQQALDGQRHEQR